MIRIRPFAPGDAEWVLARHAAHYAETHGFDESFSGVVARFLGEFATARAQRRAAAWLAWAEQVRAGSIFASRVAGNHLQLHLFYVDAPYRGQGLGQRLLDTALAHAQAARCRAVVVRTHAEHAAAGRLYARNGFRLTRAAPVHSFGQDLIEQAWEKPLRHG